MSTDDELSKADPSPQLGARSPGKVIIRVAKWMIAVAVAVGLFFAARTAIAQWETESRRLQSKIDDITLEIAGTADPSRREQLRSQVVELEATVPRLSNLRWDRIAIASLLYAIGLVPPALLLRRAVISLGHRPGIGISIAAQLLGHVGKYVPGKAMVVVLRAGALSIDGVRPLPATISVFLETFLMMAVGAAVAGLVVLWLPVPTWIAATAVSVAIVASLPTLPPILKRVAARVMGTRVVDARIGMSLFAAGWGWSILSWVFIGASFTTLITAIPTSAALPSWIQLYAIATAAISLAIVIGFASLLPGGAGVRELVLTTVLGVSIGSVHGILAAIAARILFMVVEAILAAASWAWLRNHRHGAGKRREIAALR